MIGSLNLTAPNAGLVTAQATSYPGMAHFAGTGPVGRMCFECAFFRPKRKTDEHSPGRCGKYAELVRTGRRIADAFPRNAAACRYFDAAPVQDGVAA